MVASNRNWHSEKEELAAHLTDVAYRRLLDQGLTGSFLDLELGLWRDIRVAVERNWPADTPAVLSRITAEAV